VEENNNIGEERTSELK